MTGGDGSDTTETKEVGEDKKWTVLPNGNLPKKIREMSLITINNDVYSFGKNNLWT